MTSPSKLWGVVTNDLPKDDYFINIQTSFDSQSFAGSRTLHIVSKSTYLSSKNYFFVAILAAHFVALLVATLLLFKVGCSRKKKALTG